MIDGTIRAKRRLLVVDDDDAIVFGLGRILERAGFSVITCVSGVEALAGLEGLPIDGLITDVRMPPPDGVALVEWVSRHRPGITTVLVTAFDPPSVQPRSFAGGAHLVLKKPVDTSVLVDYLRTAFELGAPDASAATSSGSLMTVLLEARSCSTGGEVRVSRGEKAGLILFHGGRVAWATATGEGVRLHQLLRARSGVAEHDYRGVLRECLRTGGNLAETLVERGLVERAPLRSTLLEIIGERIAVMLAWEGAAATFKRLERTYSSTLTFELDEVLAAAPRRLGSPLGRPSADEAQRA